MPFSAKNLLNDTKITLEKAALDKFGSAVEDFATGALGSIMPGLGASSREANRNDGSWYASSYAAALAGATSFRPKLKFLFKVQFIFTEAAKNAYPELRKADFNDFTFMIKSVERPKVDFEYEEDVNMYNFRTRVLKKIRHRDLTIVFIDDVGNKVFRFFRTLMMLHSPITRGQRDRDRSLRPPSADTSDRPRSGSGMAFSSEISDIAHRGTVDSSFGNSIAAIRVQQIFVDPTLRNLGSAVNMNSFDFINPRVISFDLDELSHEQNDVNSLTMVFDYDWMEMVEVGPLGTSDTQYGDDMRNVVMVPGVNGAPSDISPVSPTGAGGSPQGNNNPLSAALTGIARRGAQQLTSDLIGRGVRSIAGTGRFATALSGTATSALSGPIAGLVTGGVRDRLNGVASTIFAPNARAAGPTISDRSTAGVDRPISVVSSNGSMNFSSPAPTDST